MLFGRSDFPLERDPSGRFLPWIVGFMVYLAALALMGGMAAANLADRWQGDLASSLTAQVMPGPDDETPEARSERTREAARFLGLLPGVADVRVLGQDELGRLLDPWLGLENLSDDLPLPDLIAIRLQAGVRVDVADMKRRLAEAVPGAVLESHEPWLADLKRLARAVEAVAGVVVLLVTVAAALTVVFVSRSALAQHQTVIEVLSLIGARDTYIARQLQAYTCRLALIGALIGLALAAATLAGVEVAVARAQTQLLPGVAVAPWQWLLLLAVVPAAALVTLITARIAVLRALARST